MSDKKSDKIGKRSKKRFVGSMGASATLMAVLLVAMVSTGTVMATLGPAMGGFTAKFHHVEGGHGATIYPSLGQTAECGENTPLLSADIPEANATGITFDKTIPAPSFAPGPIDNVTIHITQNNKKRAAKLTGLTMQLEGLNSSKVKLGGGDKGKVGIYDNKTKNKSQAFGPGKEGFRVKATGGVVIDEGKAIAHLVTFDGATFHSGLRIDLQYNNHSLNRRTICQGSNTTA
ncbi:MAG: hypothetical protein ABEK59_00290 [Halobacteria archaeon]